MDPNGKVTFNLSLQLPVHVAARLHNLALQLETTSSKLVASLLIESFINQVEIDVPMPDQVKIPDACSIGDLMKVIGVAPTDP